MGDINANFSAKVTGIFSHWEATLAEVLNAARSAGELRSELDATTLAKHIIAALQGGIMMAKASKNGDDLQCSLESLRAMLGIKH